jgi:hypothetical protein
MDTEPQYHKIRFVLPKDENSPAGERLWAEPVGEHLYRLANIPMYPYGYAEGDIVRCEQIDGWEQVVELIEDSGNGTLWLNFEDFDSTAAKTILSILKSYGCTYERFSKGFVGVTVPPMSEDSFVQLTDYLYATEDEVLPNCEFGKWPSQEEGNGPESNGH